MSTASSGTVECPYCSGEISPKAKKCRHCGEILDPQMREMELLKNQRTAPPPVYMNAGGGGGAAGGYAAPLRRFPHVLHIIICLITGGLWFPVYVLLYLFRNKQYYI